MGEGRIERWGWRVVRSERILLNFWVLLVVMVVEFIIKFFRDYKHNIVPSLEKFKIHHHFFSKNISIYPPAFTRSARK